MRILFDENQIQKLVDNFSKVSSVNVSIFDTSFRNFTT